MWIRVFLFLLIGVIDTSLFYFMIWGPKGLNVYHELQKQLDDLQKQKAVLDAKTLQLSHEIRLLKTDNDFQEKMIRQKLRYIRNNELVYIFDDTKK